MACAQHGAITTSPPEIDTSKEEHDTINKHFNLEEVIEGRDVVCALNVMSNQLNKLEKTYGSKKKTNFRYFFIV